MKREWVSRRQLLFVRDAAEAFSSLRYFALDSNCIFYVVVIYLFFNRLKAKSVCQSEANTAQKNSPTGFKCRCCFQ